MGDRVLLFSSHRYGKPILILKNKEDDIANGKITAETLCRITTLTDQRHRPLAQSALFPPPERGYYQLGVLTAIMGRFHQFMGMICPNHEYFLPKHGFHLPNVVAPAGGLGGFTGGWSSFCVTCRGFGSLV